MEINLLNKILKKHDITDSEIYLLSEKGKQVGIDCTPKIDGVPISQESVDEYFKRNEKIFAGCKSSVLAAAYRPPPFFKY